MLWLGTLLYMLVVQPLHILAKQVLLASNTVVA